MIYGYIMVYIIHEISHEYSMKYPIKPIFYHHFDDYINMVVSINGGTPIAGWMVYFMEKT
jgi:hypothetical protein